MDELAAVLTRWRLDRRQVRDRMYRAPAPRERERWHGAGVAGAGLVGDHGRGAAGARCPHHRRLARHLRARRGRSAGLSADGRPPRPRSRGAGGTEGGGAGRPGGGRHPAGQQELEDRAPIHRDPLRDPAMPRHLHALSAPSGLRLQALEEAPARGRRGGTRRFRRGVCTPAGGGPGSRGEIFFADKAHFRPDGDLRGKWVLEGRPALVDPTCPLGASISLCGWTLPTIAFAGMQIARIAARKTVACPQ